MQQYRQLSRYRNHRSSLGVFPSSLGELPSPAPQITVFPKGSQNVVRSLDQQRPQIPISLLGDVHLWLTLPRVPPPRLQTHKASHVATLFEAMWIFDGQDIPQCNQVSDTLHLFEQLRLRVLLPGHFLDPPIVFLDALV